VSNKKAYIHKFSRKIDRKKPFERTTKIRMDKVTVGLREVA
jgi:hypothetical protein